MSKIYNFDKFSIITPIDNNQRFQESFDFNVVKYQSDIYEFIELVKKSSSSEELLYCIRQGNIDKNTRMSFLKLFRRCVSTVIDTETSKKIKKIPTEKLIETYGHTFIDIKYLKKFFEEISSEQFSSLCCLLAEYDTRGSSGYELTRIFFSWFKQNFSNDFLIDGLEAAGKDIELSSILPDFTESSFPCDFVIRKKINNEIVAVGFSRYDSTRGGAQSDDRTGGNSLKVQKLKSYKICSGKIIKIIFLSDGPGLIHNDTWKETCMLADSWEDNARVTTLKLAHIIVTREWLLS